MFSYPWGVSSPLSSVIEPISPGINDGRLIRVKNQGFNTKIPDKIYPQKAVRYRIHTALCKIL